MIDDLNHTKHRSAWVLERMREILRLLDTFPAGLSTPELEQRLGGESAASALRNLERDGRIERCHAHHQPTLWRLVEVGTRGHDT